MPSEPIQLKGGAVTLDPRLDRVFQEDWRSLNFPVSAIVPEDAPIQDRRWTGGPVLDQGQEGACVGFGWTKELALAPFPVRFPDVAAANSFARNRVYKPAQLIDEWPGTDYEGTSVLAGAKIVAGMGHLAEYRWALTVEDVLRTLSNHGPVVVGINWYEAMYYTLPGGLVQVDGPVVGGHCIVLNGLWLNRRIKEQGWLRRWEVIEWTNSWSPSYGLGGRGFITVEEFANKLFVPREVDACVPVRRLRHAA